MLDTERMCDAIARFEVARRVLGHAATVTREELVRMFGPYTPSERALRTGMTRYAYALAAARDACRDEEDRLPDPVLPMVDVVGLRVEHATCTGNTTLRVVENRLHVERQAPLDPNSQRDIALWLLADSASLAKSESEQVFDWPRRGYPARRQYDDARELAVRDQVLVLEAIALLITRGMSAEGACSRAREHGLVADPTRVREEIEARRVGLWLTERPWCQDAYQAMAGPDADAGLPAWAREAATVMRRAADSGGRGSALLAPRPKKREQPLMEWERELMEPAPAE